MCSPVVQLVQAVKEKGGDVVEEGFVVQEEFAQEAQVLAVQLCGHYYMLVCTLDALPSISKTARESLK